MESHYYEVSVKLDKVQENGLIKKVTEKYIVDALSFTEAEARIVKEMQIYRVPEFDVTAIKRTNIAEVVENHGADGWFKAKVDYITLDERTGQEKLTSRYLLVNADDFDAARNVLQESMKGTLGDWKKSRIEETHIVGILAHESA